MGNLYIVATPIGNLKDITLRALETLKEVDLILAEDTRVTRKLLSHYDIHTPLKSYHQHSSDKIHEFVEQKLEQGKNIALVTDAGTPGISDPGARLVQSLNETYKLTNVSTYKLIPIPGPSALIAALSASGVNADKFTFLGYPPHKKGRKTFFEKLAHTEVKPIVLYESPHRLQKTLGELKNVLKAAQSIVIAKELTKIHEEIWQGTIEEAEEYFIGPKSKGEFVIILP